MVLSASPMDYNYGYCHIYEDHMAGADGGLETKIGTKSQFQWAMYPDKTLSIIMEVVNKDDSAVFQGNGRYYKQAYSTIADQWV